MWPLPILGAIAVGGTAGLIVSELFGSRRLGGLIGTLVVIVVLFAAVAFATSIGSSSSMGVTP